MEKIVTDNTLAGNQAEALARYILSGDCFVRPVVGNTDIGVDLYCESIIDSEPFLHFWVQVKASRHFPNEEKPAKCQFRTADLRYWKRQPVPVIALLVPITEDGVAPEVIHVVNITLNLIDKGIGGTEYQTLESAEDLTIHVGDNIRIHDDLKRLVHDCIPYMFSAMFAEMGFILPIPTPKPTYTKSVATLYLQRYQEKIAGNIRQAAVFYTREHFDSRLAIADLDPVFQNIVETLDSDPHYHVQEVLGQLEQAKGNRASARDRYVKAIQCVRNDKNVNCSLPPWSLNVLRIEERIRSLGI